jgi:hypothetical protein
MAHAVFRLLLTAEAQVRTRVSPCRTEVYKMELGQVFL